MLQLLTTRDTVDWQVALQTLTSVFGTLEAILPTSSTQPSEIVVLVFT